MQEVLWGMCVGRVCGVRVCVRVPWSVSSTARDMVCV